MCHDVHACVKLSNFIGLCAFYLLCICYQELDDNPSLNNTHRKQMYEERKRELLTQQRIGEKEHLQILKTIAEQDAVDFRLRTMQERQKMEKQLLQEVCCTFSYLSLSPFSLLLLVEFVMFYF